VLSILHTAYLNATVLTGLCGLAGGSKKSLRKTFTDLEFLQCSAYIENLQLCMLALDIIYSQLWGQGRGAFLWLALCFLGYVHMQSFHYTLY